MQSVFSPYLTSSFVMGSFLASSSAGGLVAAGVGAAGVAMALRQFAKVQKKSFKFTSDFRIWLLLLMY